MHCRSMYNRDFIAHNYAAPKKIYRKYRRKNKGQSDEFHGGKARDRVRTYLSLAVQEPWPEQPFYLRGKEREKSAQSGN